MITDTPPGEYFLFVWIDADASGTYDPNYDLLGFYDAIADFNFVWSEPPSPNVVVAPTGLLDIDVWVGTLVLPGSWCTVRRHGERPPELAYHGTAHLPQGGKDRALP